MRALKVFGIECFGMGWISCVARIKEHKKGGSLNLCRSVASASILTEVILVARVDHLLLLGIYIYTFIHT